MTAAMICELRIGYLQRLFVQVSYCLFSFFF